MSDENQGFDFSESQGAQAAKDSSGGEGFDRELEYLNLKATDEDVRNNRHQMMLRFVTDLNPDPELGSPNRYNLAIISVKQHYAQTKQRPEYIPEKRAWREKWNAVCRKDKVFAAKFNNSCYICDTLKNKPGSRNWALAIEREQVFENGKVVGVRDKEREVFARDDKGELIVEKVEGDKKTYAKKICPAWIVVNMAWRNFFSPLSGNGAYANPQKPTITDRDYVVVRSGTDNNDTSYTFIPQAPIQMEDGTPYDMRHVVGNQEDGRPITLAEVLYEDMPDLRQIITDKTKDEYYGYYFIPGWLPEGYEAQGKTQQSSQSAPQQGYSPQSTQAPAVPDSASQGGGDGSAPSADRLKALRDRVRASSGS